VKARLIGDGRGEANLRNVLACKVSSFLDAAPTPLYLGFTIGCTQDRLDSPGVLDHIHATRFVVALAGASPTPKAKQTGPDSSPNVSRLFLLLCFLASLPATADIPLSDPVYRILDRVQTRIHTAPLPGIRPFRLQAVVDVSQELIGRGGLSDIERSALRRFLKRSLPTSNGGLGQSVSGQLYAYADSALDIRLNPLFRQAFVAVDSPTDRQWVSQTYVGLIAEGRFHDRVTFRAQHFEAREWSDQAATSIDDVWSSPVETVQLKGKTVDFRESRYLFRMQLPWFDLEGGKQAFDWGPGRNANLTLDRAGPSYVYGRFTASHKALSFDHLFALLRTSREEDLAFGTTTTSNGHRRTLPAPKRLVAHRLEITLNPSLRLGVHESVVYGDRQFEPAYAIPIAPFVGSQSYAGESDNLTFGMDISYRPRRGYHFYSALFFDDLQKFTPEAFSNQIGIQVGTYLTDPFGIQDTDLRIEYARIEPYTYAHNFNINSYTHFGSLLGHPLGPNADRIWGRVQWWMTDRFRLVMTASRSREGDNPSVNGELINVGGDAAQGRRPTDQSTRDFLAGDRTTTSEGELRLLFEPFPALRFRISYSGRRTKYRPTRGTGQTHQTRQALTVNTELNAF